MNNLNNFIRMKIKDKPVKLQVTTLLALILATMACTPQENYKKVRDEVMVFHNEVMADQDKIVRNRLRLDTLSQQLTTLKKQLPDLDTIGEKAAISKMILRLQSAEDRMNDWMQAFEPDVSGKSNAEAVSYFKAEMGKIKAIDSLYKIEAAVSGTYLNKFKKP